MVSLTVGQASGVIAAVVLGGKFTSRTYGVSSRDKLNKVRFSADIPPTGRSDSAGELSPGQSNSSNMVSLSCPISS